MQKNRFAFRIGLQIAKRTMRHNQVLIASLDKFQTVTAGYPAPVRNRAFRQIAVSIALRTAPARVNRYDPMK